MAVAAAAAEAEAASAVGLESAGTGCVVAEAWKELLDSAEFRRRSAALYE